MCTPSTSMSSTSTSALSPRVAMRPLIATLPSSISCSHVRRLPSPTAARTFCSRSVGGIERVGKEPLLERLHDVRARYELPEAGQIVDRRQAQSLEEQLRRAVQHRETGAGIARQLFDQPAL